jgi:hypothetical protein
MVVGSLVSYTLTSNDITYSVMSEVAFSTDQSVMSLPDPEVLSLALFCVDFILPLIDRLVCISAVGGCSPIGVNCLLS